MQEIVADAVNPLLGAWALWAGVRARSKAYWFGGLAGIALVWGFMMVDKTLRLWGHWGLDFSGHTATAASIAVTLVALQRRWLLIVAPIVLAYAFLMVHLAYHTWGDIASSAGVAVVLTGQCHLRPINRWKPAST